MDSLEKRRRRPPLACTLCRIRKIRCDRQTPCSNCLRSKDGGATCTYGQLPPSSGPLISKSERTPTISSHSPSTTPTTSSTISLPNRQPPNHDVKYMESRIKELEEQLRCVTRTSMTRYSSPALESHGEISVAPSGEAFSLYKTRMYGKSHWSNQATLFQDLFIGMEWQLRDEMSKSFSGIRRCKSLAKAIKSQRTAPWPLLETANLPLRAVADDLVDCYLRTTETVYRVLHIPSFKRDYDALWISDTEPSMAFIIQLKLVFAIGAVTYDDGFSLRHRAIQWTHEAVHWFSKPEFKSRLNIQSLQSSILLLLAREAVNVGGELIWISAGGLYRMAIFMGLHRNRHNQASFALQMRRRLWNTILEINLQSSLLSGSPPCLSLEDFDTECPGNYDDDQPLAEDSTPRPAQDFTQMSTAIVLRETFPIRLAIAKLLNDVGSSGSYEKTLQLDKELRVKYKLARQTLSNSPISFGHRVVEFLINYYLLCLHLPFLAHARHDTEFAYSRKVATETSLKLFHGAVPSPSSTNTLAGEDDIVRYTVSGSGLFRVVVFQAIVVVIVEIISQIQEDEGMGSTSVRVRPDLLSLLDEAVQWALQTIEIGETNIKNYVLIHIVTAQIKGLTQGLPKDKMPGLLTKAAGEAEERCLSMLQDMVSRGQTAANVNELDQMSLAGPQNAIGDWDFLKGDNIFGFDDIDPMSWLFDSGNHAQDVPTW